MADSLQGDSPHHPTQPAKPAHGRRPLAAGNSGRPSRRIRGALLPLALFLALASPAMGAPAISCHCFQDRSFDPTAPHRIEPYLLATTRNSFLAAAFDQSKKEIVRARMTGTAGEDLWVAYYLAPKTGIPASELLQSRSKADSWRSVLAARQIVPDRAGPLFGKVLAAGGNDQSLAAAAADDTLSAAAGATLAELRQFRERGADTGEIILALLISRRLGRPAIDLHADVQAGRATWGGQVSSVGIEPGEMEEEMRRLLRPSSP